MTGGLHDVAKSEDIAVYDSEQLVFVGHSIFDDVDEEHMSFTAEWFGGK